MNGSRLSRWLLWQMLGLAVVLLAPLRWWLSATPWSAPADPAHQVWLQVGAYGVAVVVIALISLRGGTVRALPAAAVLGGALAGAFLLLLLERREFFRTILVASAALTTFFVLFPVLVGALRSRWATAVSGAALGGVVVGLGAVSLKDPEPPRPRPLFTNEYVLDALFHEGVTQHSIMGGGGLAAVEGGFLISNGYGQLYRAELGPDGGLTTGALEAPAIDFGEFIPETEPEVAPRRMRVNDIDVVPTAQGTVLLMSHFWWNLQERCRTVRLSALDVHGLADPTPLPGARWRVLHEARPCSRFGDNGDPWNFLMTGGRILPVGEGRILFTVGNPSHPMLSQEPGSDLGRTLRIDLQTGDIEVYSTGHRNAQGLARDAQGRIWSTEHGPKGGDELNLLVEGGNFGWPVRTHGVEYVTSFYPDYSDVDMGTPPIEPAHAWVPSIGISNLIVLDSERLPEWRGDLLVASLRARSLYRVRVRGDRVAFHEPIAIGLRVRDLLQTPDGRIVLWTDEESLVVITARRMDASRELLTDCFSCHTWTGEEVGTAPPLQDVYGRDVASVPGYVYSDALSVQRGEWTAERLSQFLKDPAAMVPGTTMQFAGIADEATRASIIRYLQQSR